MNLENLGSAPLLLDPHETRPIRDREIGELTVTRLANQFLAVDELSLEAIKPWQIMC